MRTIHGYFENIHFSESSVGSPSIVGDSIKIRIKGIFLMKGHPLLAEQAGPFQGWLIFKGVIKSERKVIEYIGNPENPTDFKDAYEVKDGPFVGGGADNKTTFGFEGYQENPPAWIDTWDIVADSFELVVE